MKKFFAVVFMVVILTASISVADEWFVGDWCYIQTDLVGFLTDSVSLNFSGVVNCFYTQGFTIHLHRPDIHLSAGDKVAVQFFSTHHFLLTAILCSDEWGYGGSAHYVVGYSSSNVEFFIKQDRWSLRLDFRISELPSSPYHGQFFSAAVNSISLFHEGKWLRLDKLAGASDPGIPVTVESPLQQPTAFALYQNYPNPFNSSTTIRFSLSQPSEATLAIYNINGQLVRELITGVCSAGLHQVIWDGHDQHGQPVPSGIYLYKITTADHMTVKKLNLLK